MIFIVFILFIVFFFFSASNPRLWREGKALYGDLPVKPSACSARPPSFHRFG